MAMRNSVSSGGMPKRRRKIVEGNGTQNASCISTWPSETNASISSSASFFTSDATGATILGASNGSSSLRALRWRSPSMWRGMSGSRLPIPYGMPVAGLVDTMAGLRAAATMSSIVKKPTPISHRTTGVSRTTRSNTACECSMSNESLGAYAISACSSGSSARSAAQPRRRARRPPCPVTVISLC